MDVQELVQQYLEQARLMQLATVRNGRPWICTVYFVPDEAGNLYWLSKPERRHSQDITQDSRVAVAVAVKHDQPVIGIQAEGTAEVVRDQDIIRTVMRAYVNKYNSGQEFYDNFVAGRNQHWLYRIVPDHLQLFDEVHFKDGPRQLNRNN